MNPDDVCTPRTIVDLIIGQIRQGVIGGRLLATWGISRHSKSS